tara:strand:+ start:14135 stop:14356 length:222 start_codon:yes stop_codon:yes gene_type:complete
LEDRTYVILNVSDVTDEMLQNSIQKRIIRTSIDGTKTVLKWVGSTPSCFEGMTTYNNSQILTELSGTDWIDDA